MCRTWKMLITLDVRNGENVHNSGPTAGLEREERHNVENSPLSDDGRITRLMTETSHTLG